MHSNAEHWNEGVAPTIIGSVDTPDYADDVVLSPDGTKAYVADGSKLQIIDIEGF